ncbi:MULTISPECIES: hypothetical protein [Halomonas]|nr:hypothetical protein [Halomonas colorata]
MILYGLLIASAAMLNFTSFQMVLLSFCLLLQGGLQHAAMS